VLLLDEVNQQLFAYAKALHPWQHPKSHDVKVLVRQSGGGQDLPILEKKITE
jgi:hypothetical protein